ncbi:MAG TPA: zinc dependent phospholipase C family protein [Blastocatellia bacterium]|nr:zinc dependent phospholipase C family protein [Blastocatellia bacterium]
MKNDSKPRLRRCAARLLVTLAILLSASQVSLGYSVLTHQAIIDSTWDNSIKPLLVARFPQATAEELRQARAHAYGGSIIQDMGYYPFSSKFFSDLTHYVRSGDFVENLIGEARTLDELAFALGALSHYAADNSGHSVGTNRAVPVVYPELKARHGDEVTYEESPSAHVKTEFGFDVIQIARGNYAPEAYHDFIGFKVEKDLLGRAFKRTYSLELKEIFASLDLAIGTYRRTVSGLIPEMTKVAWETKKDEIEKLTPGITRSRFVYTLSRASYEQEFGREYEKPGFWAKTTAMFFRVMPKIGPFKALAFKTPTPEAEQLFLKSTEETINRFKSLLSEVRANQLRLANRNIDTGRQTRAGDYKLADKAYAELVDELSDDNFQSVSPELRRHILEFYSDLNAPVEPRKGKSDWQKLISALDRLKRSETRPAEVSNR